MCPVQDLQIQPDHSVICIIRLNQRINRMDTRRRVHAPGHAYAGPIDIRETRYEVFDERSYAAYDGDQIGHPRPLRVDHPEARPRPMHIPDAVLDPQTAAAATVVAVGGLA